MSEVKLLSPRSPNGTKFSDGKVVSFVADVMTPFIEIKLTEKFVDISVLEPRYLKLFHEDIKELVNEVTYVAPTVFIDWTVEWSDETDELSTKRALNELNQWLKTTFPLNLARRFGELFQLDLYKRPFKHFLKLDTYDFGVSSKADYDERKEGRFWVLTEVRIIFNFSFVRPVYKSTALWLLEYFSQYIENFVPWFLTSAIRDILMQEEKEPVEIGYRIKKDDENIIIGTETSRETYEEPMKWRFFLDYEGNEEGFKTISQEVKRLENVFMFSPSTGIEKLLPVLKENPPTETYVTIHSRGSGINIVELYRSRGEDFDFVIETLEELVELLKETGM